MKDKSKKDTLFTENEITDILIQWVVVWLGCGCGLGEGTAASLVAQGGRRETAREADRQ